MRGDECAEAVEDKANRQLYLDAADGVKLRKLIKYFREQFESDPEAHEDGSAWVMGLAELLCARMHAAGSAHSTITVEGLTNGGVPIGDWEIIIRQTREPK